MKRDFYLAPIALPTLLQSLAMFPFWLLFAKRPMKWRRGLLLVTWRPWVQKRWRYATTLGVIMGTRDPSGASAHLLDHEVIHGWRQYVDLNALGLCLAGVAIACGVTWWLALVVFWGSSGMLWLVPNFVTGAIRYGDAYLGSSHERHAHSETGDLHKLPFPKDTP